MTADPALSNAPDVIYFEDLQAQFAQEAKRPQGGCVAAATFGGFALLWLVMIFGGLEGWLPPWLIPLAYLLAFGGFLIYPAWVWWTQPRPRKLACPQCQGDLDPIRRQTVLATRACPLCLHVFPSRLPPQMLKIRLDPTRLPRIWLQGEVATAMVVDEASPQETPLDENPYRTPAQPLASGANSSQLTFSGCLLLWWSASIEPVRTLLKSDARLLDQPNLSATKQPDSERVLRFRQAFLLSTRRQAWMLLPWSTIFPITAAIAVGWPGLGPLGRDPVWMHLLAALMAHSVVLVLGMLLYGQVLSRGPLAFKRWLRGGLEAVDANVDPDTGYYAVRWRLIEVHVQQNLPRLKFRYRQLASTANVQLRLVNYEQATALEMTLPAPPEGVWQSADLDLRWLVRQSDPDFFGDEVHLTGDPAGKLEMCDYEVVFRQ